MTSSYLLADHEEVPLALAKNWLTRKIHDGATCPCCGQLARVTHFKINGGMAMLLKHMRRWENDLTHHNRWINVRAEFEAIHININAYNFYKLKHWGVVEHRTIDADTDARGSGYWRLTKFGQDFVDGTQSVAKYVYYYNDKLIKRSEEDRAMIDEVLGEKFSFAKLMAPFNPEGLPVPEELRVG